MLHYLDDLDSKMEAMRAQFERAADSDGAWTSYNPSLGRPVLNIAKFLQKGISEEEQPLAEPPVSPSVEAAVDNGASPLSSLESGELEASGLELNEPDAAEQDAEKEKNGSAMTSAAHKDKI